MGKEKFIDSSLLDRALAFAINAHKNTERRGKSVPYIVHPLEVVAIVSNLTQDQEILAAAALHDTVEDTFVTIDDIRKEFGDRVAKLVDSESDKEVAGKNEEESWKERKQAAIDRLAKMPIDSKMVALGDKLSNMRTISTDFNQIGDQLWGRFHCDDPKEHEWHYRGLAESLKDLADSEPYREFVYLIDDVFSRAGKSKFSYTIERNIVHITGDFDRENSSIIEKAIKEPGSYILDFRNVGKINFAGIRTLLRMYDNGVKVDVVGASNRVAIMFYRTGVINRIKVIEGFKEFDMNRCTVSGDGYTAVSYNVDDDDSMVKLYAPFIKPSDINREKRVSSSCILMGVPTPMSGSLIKANGQHGITFERIMGKKSYSRLLEAHPENVSQYAKEFADLAHKLHNTQCDTTVFESYKTLYKAAIEEHPLMSKEEKEFYLDKVNSLEDRTTCVHGDFHFGNVIVTDNNEKLFIDMADFGYGDPRCDIAMLYLVCNVIPTEARQRDYHITDEVGRQFYIDFMKYYYHSDKSIEEIEKETNICTFVGLRMIYISKMKDWDERFLNIARTFLKYEK